MKIEPLTIIFVLIITGVLFLLLFRYSSPREKYGQDASIRASSGWIAGPNYGYDPIAHFAEQIEEMKAQKARRIRIGLMEDDNLVDSPTKMIGPYDEAERFKEGHYPYVLDRFCSSDSDCFSGESCLKGKCLAREKYTPSCGSCM